MASLSNPHGDIGTIVGHCELNSGYEKSGGYQRKEISREDVIRETTGAP